MDARSRRTPRPAARGVTEAAKQGAQIVCLQELTLSPYFATHRGIDASAYAETIPDGPTCAFARDLACETGVYLTASLFEASGPGYNCAVAFSPDGDLVGKTRKQHIPAGTGYHEDEHFHPGDSDYPLHLLAVFAPRCPPATTSGSRSWRASTVSRARS